MDNNKQLDIDYAGSYLRFEPGDSSIFARYQNGKFIDLDTNEEIKLKDKSIVEIRTSQYSLSKDRQKYHNNIVRKLLLKKDEKLYFKIDGYVFQVNLTSDLYLTRKGNRPSRTEGGSCVVNNIRSGFYMLESFEPIVAPSLNQAYVRTSIKHFSSKNSHVCNVFETMMYNGKPLQTIRSI